MELEQVKYEVLRKKLELCCVWILIEIRVKKLSSSQDRTEIGVDLPMAE